jgi:hypothetical protein
MHGCSPPSELSYGRSAGDAFDSDRPFGNDGPHVSPYLLLTLVGGGALALQLALGHHGDTTDTTHDDVGFAAMFLSFRFWSFFLFATGLSGWLGTLFGFMSGIPLLVVAVITGLVAGVGTSIAMRALLSGQKGVSATGNAVGQMGRVLLAPTLTTRGKIRIALNGQLVDLLAITDEEGLATGDPVIVIAMEGAVARVTRADPALLPP